MCYSGSCAEKLISLFKSIQGCLKSISQEFELTIPEMMIMFELYDTKTLSLNELSEKIEFPKSSVSRIVDQLVNRGYVTRKIPKENRRMVELSISTKCLECIDVACINDRFNNVLVGGLQPEKSERMISALDELSLILNGDKK
ncbi:MarR family winged helix-turn-helix transcriptional regulator [Clostridium sp.]|uniref:MarR family winged helix-turn-helix transcriptional regulator n=1 Tax=Clostridium sp. TaxID=1506 RepID=UPI001A639096|nr:MarR family winged helix-turn-helix transcriptional regulator [Clostridium sp.]MBK5242575.1 winged helix-turn-helix transcriptional regulator [Clostridium sp.]